MRPNRTILRSARLGVLLALGAAEPPLLAQADVRVTVGEVNDDRYSTTGGFPSTLELKFKLSGDGMDGVQGLRVLVKSARDDQGNAIAPKDPSRGDFESPDNSLAQRIVLGNPLRSASSVSVSGTIELFAPKRDPNALVTVENAFSRPDKPLTSKALKASKVEVTVVSKERWAEERKKQKLDDKKIAEIRAAGKREGASDKEIDAVIELAKGLQEAFPVPENAVVLSGPRAGMERIQSVKILGPDGEEIHVGSTMSQGDEKTKTMILEPSKPVPPNASLRFTVLTDKARFAVPFELKDVPLP